MPRTNTVPVEGDPMSNDNWGVEITLTQAMFDELIAHMQQEPVSFVIRLTAPNGNSITFCSPPFGIDPNLSLTEPADNVIPLKEIIN